MKRALWMTALIGAAMLTTMPTGEAAPGDEIPGVGEAGGPTYHLSPQQMRRWIAGRNVFNRNFTLADGVGTPDMNADSCRACHQDPAMGGAGALDVNVSRFGYDNGEFTGYLTGKGFFVTEDGRPNYPETFASLASSLNMEHLIYLADSLPEGSNPLTVHTSMVRTSKVMGFLRSRGYKILQFKEDWLDRENVGREDLYVGCEKGTYFRYFGGDFTEVLFRTTLLDPFLKKFGVVQSGYRERRLCDFSRIVEVQDTPGPKFVFAHLAVPHPPWVFGPNGEKVLTPCPW